MGGKLCMIQDGVARGKVLYCTRREQSGGGQVSADRGQGEAG